MTTSTLVRTAGQILAAIALAALALAFCAICTLAAAADYDAPAIPTAEAAE